MVVFAVVVFLLFIGGFFVFIAANAGRGQQEWKELLESPKPEDPAESDEE